MGCQLQTNVIITPKESVAQMLDIISIKRIKILLISIK